MNVGLVNTYSTQNLGDAAIYSAIASLLPGAYIETALSESQLRPVPGVTFVDATQVQSSDLYVGVGGDIFNNPRRHFVTRKFLQNLRQLRRAPHRTMLFGQSVPRSCQGLSLRLLGLTWKQLAAVCVRDQESHQRLQRLGVAVRLSYDTAFALSGTQAGIQAAQTLFSAVGTDAEQAICLSVRAFDTMYMRQPQQCFENLVRLCQAIAKRGHCPVVLVQAQASKGEDDAAIAQRIQRQVPQLRILNPFTSGSSQPDWDVAMGTLSICRAVVGVRYHTSVLGLASGRVPFNLYYSNKGQDLTERLNLPGCSIESLDAEQHVSEIERTVEQTFDSSEIRQRVQADFAACVQQATPHLSYEPTYAATV